MLNSVIIQGRLTKDLELRYTTTTNKAVAAFSVACDRGRNNETDFINCVAWDKTAEFIDKYFSKGDMILLEGRLCQRSYETDSGSKRTVYEVVVSRVHFCGKKSDKSEPDYDGPPKLQDLDDDEGLPF